MIPLRTVSSQLYSCRSGDVRRDRSASSNPHIGFDLYHFIEPERNGDESVSRERRAGVSRRVSREPGMSAPGKSEYDTRVGTPAA